MKNSQYMGIVFLAVCLFYCSAEAAGCASSNVKAAYWPSYTVLFMPPASINSAVYSHIFYAFASMNAQTFQVEEQKLMAQFTTTVQKKNRCVKTLISIGGGGSNSTAFALLTATVYFAHSFFLWGEFRSYPTASIAKNLDWVNVMAFDYHGSWDTSATGAPAALYDRSSNVSTSYGIASWIDSGLPPCKVVMGMPLYGRSWVLKSQNETGIGAPAVAAGPKQNLSDETGVMFFSEVRDFIRDKHAVNFYNPVTD